MQKSKIFKLPNVTFDSKTSIESALKNRRSVREYQNIQIPLQSIGQILWAAQGITDAMGYRTAPSAGALYPLELYLVAGNVENLPASVYHYRAVSHELETCVDGDKRKAIAESALYQMWMKDAGAVIAITADFKRTTIKYDQRGIQYVFLEAGHVAQNICLQAISLDLSTAVVGAFEDNEIVKILKINSEEKPLYLLPIGKYNYNV